jgi:large subunit ribosomal protein L25
MAKRQIPRVQVEPRAQFGKRYTARLRKSGRLPVVIYGHGKEPVHASANQLDLITVLKTQARLLDVAVDKSSEPCLVKDIQWDHLGSTVIHVDLARVDLTQRVRVSVAVKIVGEAIGLKESGTFLDRPLAEIEVECVVTEIPEFITVDVTNLKPDEEIAVSGVKMPDGVVAKSDSHSIVAAVRTIKEEEVVAPVEGAVAAGSEPEVIGQKEKDAAAAAATEGAAKKK